LRALMVAGTAATPAVRTGLRHDDPAVRAACCQVLDHFLDEAALPELLENLSHSDPQVRAWAVHALACDGCKEGSCRPAEKDSLPVAIGMLLKDPSREVRQQAAGLVGAAVHRSPEALAAIAEAHRTDPHPAVRKVAGWHVPGGARY
ncbi:MAG TPA: HEAT repeat domain-containing protein, partial [Acidimicrobiales bacterium]|nr:HEAT repeat domain-containing protein [Acidimicrobiales bacterium]